MHTYTRIHVHTTIHASMYVYVGVCMYIIDNTEGETESKNKDGKKRKAELK